MKIAACLIVKDADDEAAHLKRCLKNLAPHVDGIFVNLNRKNGVKPSAEVRKVLRKHKASVIETEWTGSFVKARTENFAQVPPEYDWLLWVDTDDTIEHPEKIREVAAIARDIDGVYIKYDYAHDEYGNVTVFHWVARLVKNNNSFAWKSSFSDGEVTVHETLNERRRVKKAMNEEFWITHHADEERRDASLQRNITLLEGMLEKTAETPDPRILYYLATHYVDANRLLEAKELFEAYLQLSGWAEERSQAWVYLGMIYDAYTETDKARGCYMRALAENPNDPNPYVELGELELRDRLFDKAITWLEMAVTKKPDPTGAVQRPMDNTYRAYKLLSQAYVNVQKLKKARKWLTEAQKLRPFDPELEDAQGVLDELTTIRDLTKATNQLLVKLKLDKEEEKVLPLLDNLPTMMQDNPLVASARNHYRKPVKWSEKSVAILCGMGPLGNWGPKSLEKGLGGSEEAVIRISRELAALGYQVTVFGTPGEEAGYDLGSPYIDQGKRPLNVNGKMVEADFSRPGVEYKHYWEINDDDEFDIFISWRSPEQFDKKWKARKSYLWLHDVMDKEEFTKERLDNLDRIIFVGQYHRDLYPFIPEDKCLVSGNGITPEDFDKEDGKHERDPHRCVYMSSHVRGLELLYKIWPDVRKAVPDATLDVYYGWGSYDAVNRSNPERMAWKEKMVAFEKQLDGVTDHGKIGHQQIVQEIMKAGVWAYPCLFPEVYCITGVKAQAGGAIPVTSDFAALKETVKFGVQIPMKKANTGKTKEDEANVGNWTNEELEVYKQALIDMLKDEKKQNDIRTKMMVETRHYMSWANTAKQWAGDFNASLRRD